MKDPLVIVVGWIRVIFAVQTVEEAKLCESSVKSTEISLQVTPHCHTLLAHAPTLASVCPLDFDHVKLCQRLQQTFEVWLSYS